MTKKIGNLGEMLVKKWLETKNILILHQNWHCRWGEIDLIAQDKNSLTLAFIEVKTRQKSNWDNNGINAITEAKQAKICQSAELFLSEYPHFAQLPCRFDVALVTYQKTVSISKNIDLPPVIELKQPIFYENYQLMIQNYIFCAFELN